MSNHTAGAFIYTPQRFPLFIGDVAKRAFDFSAAFFGLLLLSPIFGVIALLIKRDSPGTVFYKGPRVGQGGIIFHILKFRTMYENPDACNGPKVTAQDDPRVTSIGRWLRDTKLNEFPQLWNVLKGEMSLVGPRPEDPSIVAEWPEDARREILAVRPGITSPASVLFRDEERLLRNDLVMDEYLRSILPSKLRLDILYVRNRTFLTDLDIIFLTLLVLLPQLRDYSIPKHLLFWGPLSRFVSRHVFWVSVDTPIALVAVGIAGFIWRASEPLNLGFLQATLLALGIALLFGLFNAIWGINRVFWASAHPRHVFNIILTSGVTTLLLIFAAIAGIVPFPPGLLLISGLLASIGFISVRYRERLITGLASRWLQLRRKSLAIRERVLIVGAGQTGQFAMWLFQNSELSNSFAVVGFIDDDPKKRGDRINGCVVLGETDEISSVVKNQDIGLIIFAINNISSHRRRQILENCQATNVKVIVFPDVIGFLHGHFPESAIALDSSPNIRNYNPSPVFLPKATVSEWFASLEKNIERGNLKTVRKQIQEIKGKLEAWPEENERLSEAQIPTTKEVA